MPRIAASLVVIGTLAFCIGLNTVRYPIVWEMVAPNRGTPTTAPAEAALPAKGPTASSPQPANVPRLEAEARPAAESATSPAREAAPASRSSEVAGAAVEDPSVAGYGGGEQPRGATETEALPLRADYAGYTGFANGSFLPASLGAPPRLQNPKAGDWPGARRAVGAPSTTTNYWPPEVVPSAKYASNVGGSTMSAARQTELPMTPVARSEVGRVSDAAPRSAAALTAPIALAGQTLERIDRLPPVDQVTTVPRAGLVPLSVPPHAYPRTGL